MVRPVTPRIVRITLGGAALEGLVSLGPTGHAKAYVPDAVSGEPVIPEVAPDGTLLPPTRAAHRREYTVRAVRRSSGGTEVDLDLVLHGDGPGSAWARAAAVGAPLLIAGPKSSKVVPEGVRTVLLGCDETALPAVARWLEMLPADVVVTVVAEVDGPADEAYLRDRALDRRPHLRIEWLHRSSLEAGPEGLLVQAVRGLPSADFTWCAGEAGGLVAVRRHLRRERALPASRVEITGYWRRGVAAFDHHAPLDPQDPD